MHGSKMISMTSEQMQASRKQGRSQSDWARVRREVNKESAARAQNKAIGKLVDKIEARKRGRPVVGEPKKAVSLRVPDSVLTRWKATGPGWQTRMVERLSAP
jgi:uncharacterized protein (DUF4415 family)